MNLIPPGAASASSVEKRSSSGSGRGRKGVLLSIGTPSTTTRVLLPGTQTCVVWFQPCHDSQRCFHPPTQTHTEANQPAILFCEPRLLRWGESEVPRSLFGDVKDLLGDGLFFLVNMLPLCDLRQWGSQTCALSHRWPKNRSMPHSWVSNK